MEKGKTTTTKKKTATTKKTSTTAKKPAAKKTTTVAKKTTAAKKPAAKKTTSVAKKTTTTKKPAVKKTTTSKITSAKIDELIKEVNKPIDTVEKLRKESEKSSNYVDNTETFTEEIVEEKPIVKEPEPIILEEKKAPKKKLKLKVKPVLTLIALILIIVLGIIYIPKFFNKKDSYKDKATYTTSFFIKNSKGKYALFNDSGKKLTDFIYDSANAFINNATLVYKEKEGYAIINNKGKNIVPFGKYNYISSYLGLYKVRSDKGYKLIDSEGKTIVDDEEVSISSYGDEYPFSVVTTKNEIKVLSYDAKTITTFKVNKSAKSPTVNYVGKYATVFYDGKNVIFNSKTKKVITTFKNDYHFCVNSASEDGSILSLNACTSWYETLEKDGHMLIIKGKVNDLSSSCNSISLYDDVAICFSSNGQNFININGKKAKVGDKINNRTAFVDEKNYVTRDENTNKLNFYKNGKKVKTIEASLSSVGKMQNEMYVLYVDGNYEYYNVKGVKTIKEAFKYAFAFDKNGLARVSKDGSKYYLINEKGKKVGDEYQSISNYDKYYQVTNDKNLKGIINTKGKEIVALKYQSISIRLVKDKYYAIATDENGKYYLYDLAKKKLIKESKDTITINDHYIKTSGSKTAYYTFKGKLIYKD